MTTFRKIYIVLPVLCCMAVSCTKNFEGLNTDPNRPKEITPGVMLGQMQYRIVNNSIQVGRSFTHELMQVSAPGASAGGGGASPLRGKPLRKRLEQI